MPSRLAPRKIRQASCFFLAIILLCLTSCSSQDWRTASRESAGIAPDPATHKKAVLLIYGARAWGWRGWFAIHTWDCSQTDCGRLLHRLRSYRLAAVAGTAGDED